MKHLYTILRDVNKGGEGSKHFWSLDMLSSQTSLPQSDIECVEIEESELDDVKHDSHTIAIAPMMPTKLITPVGSAAESPTGDSWGIAAVGADKTAFTGAGVVVAILDTGIDRNHPAFAGVQVKEYDFSGGGNGDRHGHGTHCAGTVFGRDLNGRRIGVARGVGHALIGKVLSDDGTGEIHWLLEGMQWAIREGAKVISMSIGFDVPGYVNKLVSTGWPIELATSRVLDFYRQNIRLFDRFMHMIRARTDTDEGPIIIAAAGNESKRSVNKEYRIGASFPAAADGIIAVGALSIGTNGLDIAPFSNTNVHVVAPGVGICSAQNGGGVVIKSGTSMACPHVAGVAALW